MVSEKKVALITGGASGMGLAIAKALVARGDWEAHLVDLNPAAGAEAAASVPATFHQCNVTDYESLSAAFKAAFDASGRLDFVFANAGIAEKTDFYARHEGSPPPPNLLVSTISLDAVITTGYLALHYFRQSPKDKCTNQSMVITSSSGGMYPASYCPIYSAAKHGVLGFMRAIAKPYWKFDGIRVNAICPGPVKTNLLSAQEWEQFPDQDHTTVDKVVTVLLMLIDNNDNTPAETTRIDGPSGRDGLWSEAIELIGPNHYYREPKTFSDERMERAMRATDNTL